LGTNFNRLEAYEETGQQRSRDGQVSYARTNIHVHVHVIHLWGMDFTPLIVIHFWALIRGFHSGRGNVRESFKLDVSANRRGTSLRTFLGAAKNNHIVTTQPTPPQRC
jgi:hypothetical protein